MRSRESIACSLAYIQRAPDLSPEAKRCLTEWVKVLDIEVTTISQNAQPVTYVVDYSQPRLGMDTPAATWLARSYRSGVA